ncbi:hypothetical protein J437_LFUL008842 [Ladona fulva]|uniref:RING-type domain-containing protein n=1 Tax=Ladona fulva TaxID=123851 RepID=A0A8K0K9A6_LADFU|nr:hypothetical protein J437_LFUL008842 [Ladona fulva]
MHRNNVAILISHRIQLISTKLGGYDRTLPKFYYMFHGQAIMHLTCAICSDLITATNCTFVTECGHLFHYSCVLRWLDKNVIRDLEQELLSANSAISSMKGHLNVHYKRIEELRAENKVLRDQLEGLQKIVNETTSEDVGFLSASFGSPTESRFLPAFSSALKRFSTDLSRKRLYRSCITGNPKSKRRRRSNR